MGDVIQAVNGDKVAYSTLDDVLPLLREAGQHKEPLQLVILAERSQYIALIHTIKEVDLMIFFPLVLATLFQIVRDLALKCADIIPFSFHQ